MSISSSRIQINFRNRETMKNRRTGEQRRGSSEASEELIMLPSSPTIALSEEREGEGSAKLGRNNSTLFLPRLIRDPLSLHRNS